AIAKDGNKRTLAVIGVNHNLDDPRWDDQLIGYGITQLVFQKMYDTGMYISYEDNEEVIQKVKKLVSRQWEQKSRPYDLQKANEITKELGCDVVSYAKITRFSIRRLRGFAGFLAAAKTTIYFDIELHVVEKNGEHYQYEGAGSATTNATGVLFAVREDKIFFDKTGVGQAITQAVENAVSKMERRK
ncbi:MAG: hypothetical protein R8K22_02520, partial [Mariprofundaceae bacterium]